MSSLLQSPTIMTYSSLNLPTYAGPHQPAHQLLSPSSPSSSSSSSSSADFVRSKTEPETGTHHREGHSAREEEGVGCEHVGTERACFEGRVAVRRCWRRWDDVEKFVGRSE